MIPGVPDGYRAAFPSLQRTDREGLRGHVGDDAAARGPGVLDDRHRVEIDDASAKLPEFRGRWRSVLIGAAPPEGVVEGPVLDLALAALHHEALRRIVRGGILG